MLKAIKKHNVSFAPIKLSTNLKQQLPAWHHLGAPPRTYHKINNTCLQTVHKTKSIKDLMKIANRNKTHPMHKPRSNCACSPCQQDRNEGCMNPQKCSTTANNILNKLHPKFNTETPQRQDNLTLTHRRKEKNSRARSSRQGEVIFDPSVTAKSSLAECFRIFTK
ncbi:hypothetical protein DEU56DRAFT_720162, partial [Suillus clintonianus]|uniref:uncharacterized protein n=1 Tax=Suillus clintonianus TaxID=1904413 RepID=UPI001B862FD8